MTLTRKQIEGRKAKAVRFTRDVVGDPERADEIEQESLESYAARRRFEIANPRRISMAKRRTVAELEAQVEELQDEVQELSEENDDLQSTLDDIAGIASGEEDTDEDGDEEADEPGE
jgi:predicted RNase H-like nuclease (RuvC/YqgF family)